MSIKIGYLNIEGLKVEKQQACCSLIDSGLFDVLFLSETWFPKSYNYMAHPYSFIHTPYQKLHKKSRQSGGILVMVSPKVVPRITSFHTTPNGIQLDIDGIKLLAIYLSPSFSHNQLTAALSDFDGYDILFGDVNVRFRSISKAKTLSSAALQEFWLDWLMKKSFTIAFPNTESFSITQKEKDEFNKSHSPLLSSRFSPTVGQPYTLFSNCELDHIFHSNLINPQLQLLGSNQFNLKTVHKYFLRFTIPSSNTSNETHVRQSLGRFRLELLEKPGIPEILADAWKTLEAEINWNIEDVNVYDSVLINSIQAVAEKVLGVYDVFEKRKSPDKVQPFLQSQLSATAAVRLFKRKQRNLNPSLFIHPQNEAKTAIDECSAKFQSTFTSDGPPFNLPPLPSNCTDFISELHSFLEPKKISIFLKQYPKDKACGLDSIHTILLQALAPTLFLYRLSGLYQLCIKTGKTPARWNRSVMYLLPKQSDPPITCDTVRPLSILPMFRRIFESLLIPIFTNPTKSFTKLHPTQAGFCKGYSTLTHAAICHHAISIKAINYAIFLDFKSAYDVTSEQYVMSSLRKRGLPIHLQHLIHSLMFRNGAFQLIVNGELSDSLTRNCGLPQGSPLSPIIFNMFIDSLNTKLNTDPNRNIPQSLFFADDGLLLCISHSESVKVLAIAAEWAKENGMMYNVKKCGVLEISPSVGKHSLYLAGNEIPVVDTYKYLGFLVDKTGINFPMHIQRQAESGTAFLKFLQVHCSEWSPYIRYIIYNTFLRPKLEYGAPLIYAFAAKNGVFDPIQQVQNEAIMWIFNATTKHLKVLRGILSALTIEQRFSHLRCSFQLHLQHSAKNNPIRKLINTKQKPISALNKNSLYERFLKIENLSSNHLQLKKVMFDFLTTERSAILSKSTSILVNYISRSARTDGLVDKVLMAPAQYQRMFLSWRRGALFSKCKCPCGQTWHRKHIPCFPPIILSEDYQKEFDQQKKDHSKNFSKMDYLLNNEKWDLAYEILKSWQKLISGLRNTDNRGDSL
jgi:hypothetical protein